MPDIRGVECWELVDVNGRHVGGWGYYMAEALSVMGHVLQLRVFH